jgi:hypothetical protein
MEFDVDYGAAGDSMPSRARGDSMPNKVAQSFNTGVIKRANDNKALGRH